MSIRNRSVPECLNLAALLFYHVLNLRRSLSRVLILYLQEFLLYKSSLSIETITPTTKYISTTWRDKLAKLYKCNIRYTNTHTFRWFPKMKNYGYKERTRTNIICVNQIEGPKAIQKIEYPRLP